MTVSIIICPFQDYEDKEARIRAKISEPTALEYRKMFEELEIPLEYTYDPKRRDGWMNKIGKVKDFKAEYFGRLCQTHAILFRPDHGEGISGELDIYDWNENAFAADFISKIKRVFNLIDIQVNVGKIVDKR